MVLAMSGQRRGLFLIHMQAKYPPGPRRGIIFLIYTKLPHRLAEVGCVRGGPASPVRPAACYSQAVPPSWSCDSHRMDYLVVTLLVDLVPIITMEPWVWVQQERPSPANSLKWLPMSKAW